MCMVCDQQKYMLELLITTQRMFYLPVSPYEEMTQYHKYYVPDDYLLSPVLAARFVQSHHAIVIEYSHNFPPQLLVPDAGNDFLDLVITADFYDMWNVPTFMTYLLNTIITKPSSFPVVNKLPVYTPINIVDHAYKLEADNFWNLCDYKRNSYFNTTPNDNIIHVSTNILSMSNNVISKDISNDISNDTSNDISNATNNNKSNNINNNFVTGYLHPHLFITNPTRCWSLICCKNDIRKLLYLHNEMGVYANMEIIECVTTYSDSTCYPYIHDTISTHDIKGLREPKRLTKSRATKMINETILKDLVGTGANIWSTMLLSYLFFSDQQCNINSLRVDNVDEVVNIYKYKTVTTITDVNDLINNDTTTVIEIHHSDGDNINKMKIRPLSGMVAGNMGFGCMITLTKPVCITSLSPGLLTHATTGIFPAHTVASTVKILSSRSIGFDPNFLPHLFVASGKQHLRNIMGLDIINQFTGRFTINNQTDDEPLLDYPAIWASLSQWRRDELVAGILNRLAKIPFIDNSNRFTIRDIKNIASISRSLAMTQYITIKPDIDNDSIATFVMDNDDDDDDDKSVGDKLKSYQSLDVYIFDTNSIITLPISTCLNPPTLIQVSDGVETDASEVYVFVTESTLMSTDDNTILLIPITQLSSIL